MPPAGPPVRLEGVTMGTRWSVRYLPSGDTGRGTAAAIRAALAEVVAQMSTWEAESDISRFNRAPAGSRHVLPLAFAFVLDRALHWARASGGAFDPTAGPLVDVWGFGPREADAAHTCGISQPPDDIAVAAAQRRVGWQRLRFDSVSRVLLQPGHAALDLSGIAKGFAVDHVCAALRDCGLRDYLVDIGGELRAAGRRADGSSWQVGIDVPDGGPALPLPLDDCAIATSGDAWHAFEHAGRRYGHTIDPRTGRPVAHDLVSVSVVHAHCADADALATALLVMGPVAGPDFAERHGIAAWFLRRTGSGLQANGTRAFAALLP